MATLKMAFLDHSYHQKTHSSDFFLDAWTQSGWTVIRLWDDEWSGGPGVEAEQIAELQVDLLVSWQVLKEPKFYLKTGVERIFLIPMFDSSSGMKSWDWWPYRRLAFIHFSKKLFRRLHQLGISGHSLQFFPDPATIPFVPWPQRHGGVFVWERKGHAPFGPLLSWLAAAFSVRPIRLVRHLATDPGEVAAPLANDNYHVLHTSWSADQSEYSTQVSQCHVYIAPRPAEGIGLSFLEAMASGLVVVANRESTMDEYIASGKNGLLVKWRKPPQRWTQTRKLETMGMAARSSIEAGRQRFESQMEFLVSNWKNLAHGDWKPTLTGCFAALLAWGRTAVLRPLKTLGSRRAKRAV